MHPISTQSTHQSALSNNQPTDAKGQWHMLPRFNRDAESNHKFIDSFQHFFDLNVIDTPHIEPDIPAIPDTESKDSIAVRTDSDEHPNLKIPTSDSAEDFKINVAEVNAVARTQLPMLFRNQTPLTDQNRSLLLGHGKEISLNQSQIIGPENTNQTLSLVSGVKFTSQSSQTKTPTHELVRQATSQFTSTQVSKEMAASQRAVQSAAELMMALPVDARQAPTDKAENLLEIDTRRPTKHVLEDLKKPLDEVKLAIPLNKANKNISPEPSSQMVPSVQKPSYQPMPQTQSTLPATAHMPVVINTAGIAIHSGDSPESFLSKGMQNDPMHFVKSDVQQTLTPMQPFSKMAHVPQLATGMTPIIQPQIQPNISISDLLDTVPTPFSETIPLAQLQHTLGAGRADLPIHMTRQLAEVVQHMPSRPVEITLSPEELGRVRLSVSTSETGVVVNVLAERPETLDLLRRHVDQLSQEFQHLGYKDIAFSFAGAETDADNDGESPGSEEQKDSPAGEIDRADATATQIHLSAGAAAGLDLRL